MKKKLFKEASTHIENDSEKIDIMNLIIEMIENRGLSFNIIGFKKSYILIVDYKYFIVAIDQLFNFLYVFANKNDIWTIEKIESVNKTLIIKICMNSDDFNLDTASDELRFTINVFKLHGVNLKISKINSKVSVNIIFPIYRLY